MNIEDLILPDTPSDIREMYLGYEQEAKIKTFALVEEEYIIVDTETTGLELKSCELIEIAAARVRGLEVLDRFHTYIKPSHAIPQFIVELTGITDADVESAPSSEEALSSFREFVRKTPVIAHNVSFDRKFLNSAKGGGNITDTWIDSLALSRIALPRLSSHSLANLAQCFHCAPVTHSAMDDVDALIGVWRVILVGLSHLPTGLLNQMAMMHSNIAWPYRSIFQQIALANPHEAFSLINQRYKLMPRSDKVKVDALDILGQLNTPTSSLIEHAFAPGGVVDSMYSNYHFRIDQLNMAKEVRDALDESTCRCIEAGTGVGKSVAYLLPSILYAKQNQVTIGVATKTNALADQLMTHELPLLNKVIDGGVDFCIIKGYTHYPCMARVKKAMSSLDSKIFKQRGKSKHTIEVDVLNAIATVLAFSCQSSVGDIDSSGIRWSNVPRSLLTCTSEECKKKSCPFFNSGCFVQSSRRAAAHADVVVTNHALLLRNIEADNALLPPIRHWVVDEAHSFEAEARKQWALDLNVATFKHSLSTFKNEGANHCISDLLYAKADIFEQSALLKALLQKGSTQVAELNRWLDLLSDELQGLGVFLERNSRYALSELWINEQVRESETWQTLLFIFDKLSEYAEELYKTLISINAILNPEEDTPKPDETLSKLLRDLSSVLALLAIVRNTSQETMMVSVEMSTSEKYRGYETIKAQFVDVGQELADKWLNEMLSIIFASATIEVSGSFKYFNRQVGLSCLEDDRYKNLKLNSAFNYEEKMNIFVVNDMPQQAGETYIHEMADVLYDIHVKSKGSTLTLFTNRYDMEACYELVMPRLQKVGLELYKQDDSNPTHVVKNKFINSKSSSLFALKSFWEGIDAQGDTLRTVVITKLPFSNPKDPLYLERELRESNAWRSYYIPEAVISLKQAVGRLLRNENDEGTVYILDSRMDTRGYGSTFKKSLPVVSQSISKHDIL